MQKTILSFLIISLFIISGCGNQISGNVTANLENSKISSGKATKLIISAENTGKIPFQGEFKVSVDDSSSVSITYPDINLLSFNLQPGEKIVRSLTVQATSKTKRTDYGINVWIVDSGQKTIDRDDVILSVRQ